MIGKIFVIFIGLAFIGLGIWWNKKYHEEKFVDDPSVDTGSILGDILAHIFLFIMRFSLGIFLKRF